MATVNFSANLFLEVNELNRLKKSIVDDGYKKILKCIIKSFGIILDENAYFKTSNKNGSNTNVIINPGLAIDSNLNVIKLLNSAELEVPNNGTTSKQWIIIEYKSTNIELGTVNVSSTGELTGNGTEFLSVLRGQPNFPVKVKLISSQNTSEYEVVDVTSDTVATLSGNFVAENSIKYEVIGTFTPGFQPSENDKYIYSYDDCNISVIESDDIPTLEDNQYIIALCQYDNNGYVNITDERNNYKFSTTSSNSEVDPDDNDSLVSLLSASIVSKNRQGICLEMILEHGYEVTKYELTNTATSTIFSILSGSNNFLGADNIPDNIFSGWLLVNRNNMKKGIISKNIGKSLYLDSYDSELFDDISVIDFIIVPNFKEIEYQITLSNNTTNSSVPYRFKYSIQNVLNRINAFIAFPTVNNSYEDNVTVSIKYRFIGLESYAYHDLAIAQYTNVEGISETLANSNFSVNVKSYEPEEEKRNYS